MREAKMLFPKDVEIERSREGMPTSSSEHGIQPLRRPKQNVPAVQVPASCFYTLTEFVAEAPVPHTHTHTRQPQSTPNRVLGLTCSTMLANRTREG